MLENLGRPIWERFGALLGPILGASGANLGAFGVNLGPSWANLGPSWANLGHLVAGTELTQTDNKIKNLCFLNRQSQPFWLFKIVITNRETQ